MLSGMPDSQPYPLKSEEQQERYRRFSIRFPNSKNPQIIFVLFYDVHKYNMSTINLGDGREAPSKFRKKGAKRLKFLVYK